MRDQSIDRQPTIRPTNRRKWGFIESYTSNIKCECPFSDIRVSFLLCYLRLNIPDAYKSWYTGIISPLLFKGEHTWCLLAMSHLHNSDNPTCPYVCIWKELFLKNMVFNYLLVRHVRVYSTGKLCCW